LGEEEELSFSFRWRRAEEETRWWLVSGGKEKIFDGNGEVTWVAEKRVKEKK